MSNATNRGSEGLLSLKGAQASLLLREAALDNRLITLREIALTLLGEVESLRTTQPPRSDHNLNLQEEVQRFEIDLIRTTLERTGGNQTRAARLLGIKLTTLNTKIKRYKISCVGNGVLSEDHARKRQNAA